MAERSKTNLEDEVQQAEVNLDGSTKLAKGASPSSFLKNYVLPRAVFLTVGLPKNSFGSVDVTNRCNLRCKHCYFFEQEYPEELSKEGWIEIFKKLSKGPTKTMAMTWVGGEPLLRKDIIEEGKEYFPHNIIVSNGLIPLPDWKDVYFHISIDGDEEAHEKQRNQRGIYREIMRNVDRPDLDVSIAYCISSLNIHCIEKVLDEWKDVGIKGFLFSFYTPIESIKDPLFPGWKERDRIIDRLTELKEKKYGDFIQNETRVLQLMKSDTCKKVTDKCVFLSKGISMGPMGEKKEKCMMGEKADCDRCGCIVPFHLHFRSERRKVLNDIAGDLSSFLSSKTRHLFNREKSV